MSSSLPSNYIHILSALKERISVAKQRAALAVNSELIAVYWEIGNVILEQQKIEGWGSKVITRLATDLKIEFPDMTGFSERNLKYMRAFAEAYSHFAIVQAPLAQIENQSLPIVQAPLAQIENTQNQITQAPLAQLSWYHHITLLDKVKEPEIRAFYIQKTIQNGWSRNVMLHQIESGLHLRQGKAITNFELTLPKPESDLAREMLKNPYNFDFLSLGEEMRERDLEQALIQHIKKFMLELGKGFAYVGNQFNLNVEGDDYFLDLLFFNFHLNCFVIFELKVGEFKPEFAGKLNFYINTLDKQVKMPTHAPTIGVLLCKTPNKTVVEFSLNGIHTPMGISEYQLTTLLPQELKGEIPSIEELEAVVEEETEKLLTPVDKKLSKLKEKLHSLKTEAVQETVNEENTKRLFEMFVLPLKHKLEAELQEKVAPMFKEMNILLMAGNRGFFKNEDEQLTKYLSEELKYRTDSFRIEPQLNVFKKAGLKAFNINHEIVIKLSETGYGIKLNHHLEPVIMKMYHQLPTDEEVRNIILTFMGHLVDDITFRLENLDTFEIN